jgi:hypothetical protein
MVKRRKLLGGWVWETKHWLKDGWGYWLTAARACLRSMSLV